VDLKLVIDLLYMETDRIKAASEFGGRRLVVMPIDE
jgi:hypothetical protein